MFNAATGVGAELMGKSFTREVFRGKHKRGARQRRLVTTKHTKYTKAELADLLPTEHTEDTELSEQMIQALDRIRNYPCVLCVAWATGSGP